MNLHESGEMYLETIYMLSMEKSKVRAIDVGESMGYSKPSVSRALSILKKDNLVVSNQEGYLSLTEEGLEIAKKIYDRHTLLTDFLVKIGLDPQTASDDACKMEHAISDTTYIAIQKHLDSLS